MKTDEEIKNEANISISDSPNDYNYPNCAVDEIKTSYYIDGYRKAIEDSKQLSKGEVG